MTKIEKIEAIEILEAMRENPKIFIQDILQVRLWSGMELIIDTVFKNKRTSVRACHGISKTFSAAVIAVTFLNLYSPSIVITTAPTNRQIKDLLWKEINNFYIQNRSLAGELTQQRIQVEPDWYMVGFSTDNATRIEGYHSANILWILDEAKGIPQWVYDSIEGSITGGNAKVLEISTTDGADQQCPFRKHHTSERSVWNCIKLSAYDSPFVSKETRNKYIGYCNKELDKYRENVNTEWEIDLMKDIQLVTENEIDEKIKDWLNNRPELWETKILGEFATIAENNIIPLAWVESAINSDITGIDGVSCEYGLDIARMGSDRTVLVKRRGGLVIWIKEWGQINLMETTGRVIQLYEGDGAIKVDIVGVGSGVFDRLAEQGIPVIGIESGACAWEKEIYYNVKAEMWFRLRGLFEAQKTTGNSISIPNDPELIEELTAMKYFLHSDGRIRVEKKEDFKKRMKRSPDKADALVYAFAEFSRWGDNGEF